MTWKDKDRALLVRAIGHEKWSLDDAGRIVGDGIPDDKALNRAMGYLQEQDTKARIVARKAQMAKREPIIRQYFRQHFRLADVVIVQGLQRFGGGLPEEITAKHPELVPWGLWLRDMKRAIDASGDTPPALIPMPPLPAWIKKSPALDALCREIGQ